MMSELNIFFRHKYRDMRRGVIIYINVLLFCPLLLFAQISIGPIDDSFIYQGGEYFQQLFSRRHRYLVLRSYHDLPLLHASTCPFAYILHREADYTFVAELWPKRFLAVVAKMHDSDVDSSNFIQI